MFFQKLVISLILLGSLTQCLAPVPPTVEGVLPTPVAVDSAVPSMTQTPVLESPEPATQTASPVEQSSSTATQTPAVETPTRPVQPTPVIKATGSVPLVIAENIQNSDNWYMAGANPQRTSWVSEQVDGNMSVEWYRPIEAFIDFKTQVIAVDGILYISSARGLYALDAATGELVWRYDTEMPLGPSPTVAYDIVFVGGHDKRIHALSAETGELLWLSEPAGSGFDANPVVANERVYAGNRDGYFYAFDAATGNIVWRYPDFGQEPLSNSISQSAAYDENSGTLYFAGNDMYAYALNAETGALVWRSSSKLYGQDIRHYWPVIYQDYVVFLTNSPYRSGSPGSDSSDDIHPEYPHAVPNLLIPDCNNGEFQEGRVAYMGPRFTAGGSGDAAGIDWRWTDGTEVMDASAIIDLFRDKPHLQFHIYLNKQDGEKYETPAPVSFIGNNGNGAGVPSIVMPDGVIYQSGMTSCSEGVAAFTPVIGWHIGSPYVSITGQGSVVDEPQVISGGGNRIYRKRYYVEGSSSDISSPGSQRSIFWNEHNRIANQAPDYDSMMHIVECQHAAGFCYWYGGMLDSVNGIYGNGRDSPLVPHQGKLYLIDRNAIIAFSPQGGSNGLPVLEIKPGQDLSISVSQEALLDQLDREIVKILEVYSPGDPNRFLKPGYYNDGQNLLRHHDDYFRNPGETLYTLALAYPHLSTSRQAEVSAYLADYYQTYFGDTLYAHTGWAEGTSRNAMLFPPVVEADFANYPKSTNPGRGWTWRYPQINIYALWKYAQINPSIAPDAYDKAKSVIEFHNLDEVFITFDNGDTITLADRFEEYPFELQKYVAGYIGFLGLYDLVGQPSEDAKLRDQAENMRDTYLAFRYQTFSKDSYWYTEGNHHNRKFNIARNFMWLVPEVADYLGQNLQPQIQQAVTEYDYAAPYWFLTGYQASYMETAAQPLYDSPAMLQAKAWILDETKSELYKYIDAPVFERGDLFYIQNLVAMIEAPGD